MKSKIPTPEHMMQVDKEAEKQRANIEKDKVTIEQNILPRVEDCEDNLSSSSMSMYSLDLGEEGSNFPSNRNPNVVIHNAQLSMHVEGVYNSPITKKVPSERHSTVHEEDHPSSYNIEEIFGAFTFNFHRKEVS